MVSGHLFRITAMFHAASNFNHLVQTRKKANHQLVKTGPYYWSRHPSYLGWFLWAVGTQIVLTNVLCMPLWFYAAIKFFYDRVDEEEYYLMEFFGDEYIEYASRTPIGIPFVPGNEDLNQLIIAHRKQKIHK